MGVIEPQSVRYEQLIEPRVISNAQVVGRVLDTADCNDVGLLLQIGTAEAAFTELSFTESDSPTSGFGTVTTSVFGATGAPALPAATDDHTLRAWFVSTAGRKRYWRPQLQVATGNVGVALLAVKGRMKEGPKDADSRNLVAQIIV